MVEDEVCRTPKLNYYHFGYCCKTFFFHELFNEDGPRFYGTDTLNPKPKKLDQMLLKFAPLCSLAICNMIAS